MTIAIIPARYASSRFPGKPLAMLCGRTVIQRACENASKVADRVVVATDDMRIARSVADSGFEAVITKEKHRCGTGRVWEAYRLIGDEADIVLNLQGDEPCLPPKAIRTLIDSIGDSNIEIASIASHFPEDISYEQISSPDHVKVVVDNSGFAMYFSRSVIPFVRDLPEEKRHLAANFLCHIGAYAFRPDTLKRVAEMPLSPLERVERLEQLTWLFHGIKVKVTDVQCPTISIDTPADLEKAQILLTEIIRNKDNKIL